MTDVNKDTATLCKAQIICNAGCDVYVYKNKNDCIMEKDKNRHTAMVTTKVCLLPAVCNN